MHINISYVANGPLVVLLQTLTIPRTGFSHERAEYSVRSTSFCQCSMSVFRLCNGQNTAGQVLEIRYYEQSLVEKGEQRQNFCLHGLLLIMIGYSNKPKNKIEYVLCTLVRTMYYNVLKYQVRTIYCTMYNVPYCSMYNTVVRTNVVHTMYNQTYNVCNVASVVRRMYCSKYHEKKLWPPCAQFCFIGTRSSFFNCTISQNRICVRQKVIPTFLDVRH